MTPDVNVVLLDFPNPGNEMVFENEDGSFTIMINSRLSHNRQLIAYNHAMKHIKNDDFQKQDIQMIEAIAHATETPQKTERISSERFLERIKKLRKEKEKIQWQLQQAEAEAELRRSMEGMSRWEVPSSSSWFA